MIFILARERGLSKAVQFDVIKEEMEKENADRETSVKSGKIVYGNKNYSMSTYLSYSISNLSRELIKLMEDNELKYTDEQILSYCQENGKDVNGLSSGEIRSKYGLVYRNELLVRYVDRCIEKRGVVLKQEEFDGVTVQ